MKYGLIGEKLGHSFSVEIHQKIGLYEYELCPLKREELADFLTKKDFCGINVTIPYKKDVIPYLDSLSPAARLCGAVNTVVKREGRLLGDNTDFYGMQCCLERAGIDLKGKDVLILGSGGTSGTALALAQHLGAASVHRVSRSARDGFLTYEEAAARKSVQILMNTTPCGMYPDLDAIPIDLASFPRLEGIFDAIYNPLKSRLVLWGEKHAIPATGGLYMLVAQALRAAEIFTGEQALMDRAEPIFQALFSEKKNIVLTGMPGSGKSTLGRALALSLGKEFVDSDEEIVKRAKKSIPQIFREEGEGAFRDLESSVIRSLSARQGLVLATGGGVPLRQENMENLRANGTVLFLDAPLSSLLPTDDRPLSSNQADLKQRYEERYEIYLQACHKRIPVSRNVEENLLLIEKELL